MYFHINNPVSLYCPLLCISRFSAKFYDLVSNSLLYDSTLLELTGKFPMLIMQHWITKGCWKGWALMVWLNFK